MHLGQLRRQRWPTGARFLKVEGQLRSYKTPSAAPTSCEPNDRHLRIVPDRRMGVARLAAWSYASRGTRAVHRYQQSHPAGRRRPDHGRDDPSTDPRELSTRPFAGRMASRDAASADGTTELRGLHATSSSGCARSDTPQVWRSLKDENGPHCEVATGDGRVARRCQRPGKAPRSANSGYGSLPRPACSDVVKSPRG